MMFRYAFVVLGVGMAGVWVLHMLLRSVGVSQQAVMGVAKWTALHPLTDQVGERVFGVRVDWSFTGSGDTAANWVSIFTLLVVAAPIAVMWSVLDRRRPDYARLYAWFRLVLRLALMSALLLYGVTKLLPSQMAFALDRLVEPFGDLSPMAVLWSQTASSEPYEIALGAAEITAGVLLILPFTAGLGAVLAVVVTLQVFLLNLTFDVPVKILSGQLLVYAVVLAAPEIVRVVRALTGHAVPGRGPEALVQSPRGRRILVAAQAMLGLWVLFTTLTEGHDAWRTYGNGRPHSALYGIWDVTEYTVAGQEVPALVDFRPTPPEGQLIGPTDRFRRLIFDVPQGVTAQRMDDSLVSFPVEIDADLHTVTITKDLSHQWKLAILNYDQPQADQLNLDGQLAGRPVHLRLTRVDLDRFRVISRGFHWVQPVPYLR
ncbi:DoxX family protein [Nocardia niigatensis]